MVKERAPGGGIPVLHGVILLRAIRPAVESPVISLYLSGVLKSLFSCCRKEVKDKRMDGIMVIIDIVFYEFRGEKGAQIS